MTNETTGGRARCWSPAAAAASARRRRWKCAQQGWAVAVNYTRDRDAAERIVDRILATGGQARALQADVADEAQVLKMFAAIDAEMAPLGALVNNAGVIDLPGAGRHDDGAAPRADVRDQRDRLVRLRARGGEAAVDEARRARRRDRQPVVGRGPARRARPVCRLRRREGCDRRLHARPRQGSGDRRHPRQRGPARHHRDRHPCVGRAARSGARDGAAACRCSAPAAPKRSPRRSPGCSPMPPATPPAP